MKKTNIVLIYTDQQRYDTLGYNGNSQIKTPFLDGLARDGVSFTNSFVTCPLCVPSRISLFTGRYPHSHRSFDNSVLMKEDQVDYISQLKTNGYITAMVGKDHCFGNRLKNSFDYIKEAGHMGYKNPETTTEYETNMHRSGHMFDNFCVDKIEAEENITSTVFKWSTFFLEENKENPFFLWISIPDPHPPYMISEPYASMYDVEHMPLPISEAVGMENKPYKQKLVAQWDARHEHYKTDLEIQHLKSTYWGMVSCIDDHIGQLIEYLKANELYEDTLIVFTSDHGDYLGDHNLIRKGPQLYDCLSKVPLIFHCPKVFTSNISHALVSNIDIFPTIFDYLGLNQLETSQGESFLDVLTEKKAAHRSYVCMEHGIEGQPLKPDQLSEEASNRLKEDQHHHLCPIILKGKSKAIRTMRYKYVYNDDDVDELYDIVNDPNELYNISGDIGNCQVINELRGKLITWLIKGEDR